MKDSENAAIARVALFKTCLRTGVFRAALLLTGSLLPLTLAGPASAATSNSAPVLINATNMAWGAQGGNGEEVALAVDPNSGNVYATDFDGHISRITQSPAGTVAPNVNRDPDLAAIYAANPFAYPGSVISLSTISATDGSGSQGMALDPKTGNIYVACEASYSTVYVFNVKTNSLVTTIPLPDPRAAAIDSNTGKVYVTNYGPGTVSVIDEKSNSVTATIPVGSGPQVPVVDPQSKRVYVTNYRDGTVSVIDETSNSVTATIPVGPGGANPYGIAVDPKIGKVYVANYFAETISVIDEKTESVIATIPDAGYHPLKMAADSATGVVYVLNRAKDPGYVDATTALVIDEKSNTVTGTFNVFPGPRSIAIDQTRGLLFIGGGSPNSAASVAIYQTGH